MKIALITDDGKSISQHFGRAPYYLVVTLEDGKEVNRELRPKQGHNQFHRPGNTQNTPPARNMVGTMTHTRNISA
jgi:predicted Fe-Mo cluster-binding NifX family protein